MKTKLQYTRSMIMAVMVIAIPCVAMAQFDPGGSPDVPVDGGLSLLLAAGVSYVAKKGYDARKKRKNQENPQDKS